MSEPTPGGSVSEPTPQDWKVFLEHFDKVCLHEAKLSVHHPHLTAYSEEERKGFPVPEVAKCRDWILEQTWKIASET